MDMLQHFEDNLNMNINNKQHLANFLRTARTVRKNLVDEYKSSGAFVDPANFDPYKNL